MSLIEFDISKENLNPFDLIPNKWFLVTAGNENGFNTMTASWGFMGHIWGKNVVQTVIRPQRYTKEFIDKREYFTISFFGDSYKKALSFCGSKSGRDVDKVKETGLSPLFIDGTTSFEEAELVLVCKKIYTQELKEDYFLDKELLKNYERKDFHTTYYGEIIKSYKK